MGGGSYSHESYNRLATDRTTKSQDQIFTQSAAQATHKDLDPKNVKFRESRDSADHPNSNAIAVMFDQTGSMGKAPEIFAREALGGLMKILLSKGYIDDPQVMFGAFGDYQDGRGQFQVGQFESDIRMDDCLTKLWLVGGGCGQGMESSQFVPYELARHTSIDCWEKRGKKGYAFIVTDELCFPIVSTHQVKEIFGDTIESDIPVANIIREAQEKYELFVLFLDHENGYNPNQRRAFKEGWVKLLGERVLTLEDPRHVSELIATTIGTCEGHDMADITQRLKTAGSGAAAIKASTTALANFRPSTSLAKASATMDGELSAVHSSKANITSRL